MPVKMAESGIKPPYVRSADYQIYSDRAKPAKYSAKLVFLIIVLAALLILIGVETLYP